MLNLDDPTWPTLSGGRRTATDIRPWLTRLATETAVQAVWDGLWDELHHQGDVGLAAYAAVPHMVQICRDRGAFDWNVFALTATIELARDLPQNPVLPEWARRSYDSALHELMAIGLRELPNARESVTVRAILALVAVVAGERTHGSVLLEFDGAELRGIVSAYEAG